MRSEFPDGYVHDLSQDAIDQARAEIPDHLLAGLDDYIKLRQPTGHFLMAVLENDLCQAFNRADIVSEPRLPYIVRYLHWCLPSTSYGSPEKVKAWLAERTPGQRTPGQDIREGDEDRHSGE